MNAFAAVIFFAAAAAPKEWAARRARQLSSTYIQSDKLTAADAVAGDEFGFPVAIDGATVVIGAWQRPNGGSGNAYVYRTSDGGATYGQVAKLTAADASSDDWFGFALAIDGDTVVIGAAGKDGMTGAAYIFRTTDGGTTYGQVAKLTAFDAAASDRFGTSVAIDGSTVVVGSWHDDDDGNRSGSVYVYRTNNGGATYDQVIKLTAADAAAEDYFGISVAIDGNTAVVGTYGDDDAGSRSGSAYVFRTADGGATYDQVAKLTAADAAADDHFGRPVAISGDTVMVGAANDGNTGLGQYDGSGSVYVFRTNNGVTYSQVAKLTAADAAANDYFGISVAIDGATVVVGAHRKDGYKGAVYLLRTTDDGATYSQVAKVTASDAADNDYFGGSVAIDGGTVVVGAVGDDDSGSASGSAYVFAPEQQTVAPTVALTASDGGDGGDNGGYRFAVAVIAGAAAVGALLLLLVGVSCFFYGRSKGSAAEPSGVNSRPEPRPQPPKEVVPAEEAAVVTVAPEAEETSVEQPPPPPAKSWFRRGEHEPTVPQPEAEKETAPPLSPFSALRAARERELAPLDPDA
jgi:hypothetical protein